MHGHSDLHRITRSSHRILELSNQNSDSSPCSHPQTHSWPFIVVLYLRVWKPRKITEPIGQPLAHSISGERAPHPGIPVHFRQRHRKRTLPLLIHLFFLLGWMCRPAVVCALLAAWACGFPALASCAVSLNYRPVIGKTPLFPVCLCHNCYHSISCLNAGNSRHG